MTLACVFEHISFVEKLIDDGPDEIVQTLLDSGTLTDHENDKGATALSYATIVDRFEIVRMLLRAGTDPNIKPMRI